MSEETAKETIPKEVVEEDTIENMDVSETMVDHTPVTGCGKTTVEFDKDKDIARDPDTTFDDTLEGRELDGAPDDEEDADCLELETSDEDIYNHEDIPDANTVLNKFISGCHDDWGYHVENEPNYHVKEYELKNYDPLGPKAEKIDKNKYIRKGIDLRGNTVILPGTYIQEQGLCKSRTPGIQTQEYSNWIDFAAERLSKVRIRTGKPDAVPIPSGEVLTSPFSKEEIVLQFKSVTEDYVRRLDDLETEDINRINIKKGKKILKEVSNLLDHMNENIVPTTDRNLKKCIQRTAILRIKSGETPHELDTWDKKNKTIGTSRSPPMLGYSMEKRRELLDRWLENYLLPVLEEWIEEFEQVLPEGMKSLATFVGLDLEDFAVPSPQRGDCHVCNRPPEKHKIMKICLLNFRIGYGTFFVSLEGHGAEGMGRGQGKMPPERLPENSLCVPLTDCEVKKQANYITILKSIVDIFFNEKKATCLPTGFDVKNGERKSLKELLEILYDKDTKCGFRVAESSIMLRGSFPNICMRNFLYKPSKPERALENAGTQTNFFFGRRVPGHLYPMPTQQGVFSLKKLLEKPKDKTTKETMLYFFYNTQNSTLTQYSMLFGVIALILQSPVMVACGATNFIHEFCLLVLEVTSRVSVTGKNPWKCTSKNVPEAPNRLVMEVLDITNSSSGTTQISRFLGGCLQQFGISQETEFCFRPVWQIQSNVTSTEEPSVADVATGKEVRKQQKKMGVSIQEHEEVICDPDVTAMVVDKATIDGMDEYNVSEDNILKTRVDLSNGVRTCSNPEAEAQLNVSTRGAPAIQPEDANALEDEDPIVQLENPDVDKDEVHIARLEVLDIQGEDTLITEPNYSQKRGGENRDVIRRSEEPKSKKRAVVDNSSGIEKQVESKNEGWSQILELLPSAERTVKDIISREWLTEFDVQRLVLRVQQEIRDITDCHVIKANNRSKEAIEEQENIEKKKADVNRIKCEASRNHVNIMKLMGEQTRLRAELKEANGLLTQARRDGVIRKALERENLEAERDKRDEDAVKAGALMIKMIKEKAIHRMGFVDVETLGEEPPEPAPALLTPITTMEQNPVMPEDLVPLRMLAFKEHFLAYAKWRWSYMCLVKTLMEILNKAEKAIEKFDGKPAQPAVNGQPAVEATGKGQEKFKNGSFKTPGDKHSQTVAQISKIRAKVTTGDEINWGNSRKLIACFKTLALAYLDERPIENEEEIDGTESVGEKAQKNKQNANIRCYKFLKEFAVEVNEACKLVTGSPLGIPWTCENLAGKELETMYEDIFNQMAERVLSSKIEESSADEAWDIAKAKSHLEWIIYRFICPTKLFYGQGQKANADEQADNNDIMETEVNEDDQDGEIPATNRKFAERVTEDE